MKKICLLFVLGFLTLSLSSQSFVIHDLSGNNVTGSTQYGGGDACSNPLCSYYVLNVSGSAKTIKACRHELSILPGTQNAITFDLINYVPAIDTSALSSTVPPGDSVYFEGDYFPNCNVGTSIIQYCFFDVNNTVDQSCLTENFQGVVISVNEIPSGNHALAFYPQPSSQTTNCFLPFNSQNEINFLITDCFGKIIECKSSCNKNELSIDVSDLANGIYFLEIISSEGKSATGKIIIAH